MTAPQPPAADEPPRRETNLPMVGLGILLSFVLAGLLTGFGAQYVSSGGPAIAFTANVAVLAIGGLVCLFRSTRWRSLGMGLMIGWAVGALALGACIALIAQSGL